MAEELDLSNLAAQMMEVQRQKLGLSDSTDPSGLDPNAPSGDTQNNPATGLANADQNSQQQEDIFKKFFEPLGYKTVEEAVEAVKGVDTYAQRQAELESQLQLAKEGPKFGSEEEENLYNWAIKYNGNTEAAFDHFTKIQRKDLSQMSDKEALELDFLIKYKNLPSEDAKILFDDEFNHKYSSAKVDEDDLEAVQAKQQKDRVLEIRRKTDAEEAKQRLKTFKEEFGKKPETPPSPEQQAKKLVVERTIADVSRRWDDSLRALTKTEVSLDNSGAEKHLVDITEEDKKHLDAALRPIIENRANYGEDGRFGIDMDALRDHFLFGIKGKQSIRESWNQGAEERNRKTIESSINRNPLPTATDSVQSKPMTDLEIKAAAIKRNFS